MSKQSSALPWVGLFAALGVIGPATAASLFYAGASACLTNQPCDTAPSQSTMPGGAPGASSISRSYSYTPPAGGGGGYSFGVNSSSEVAAPDTWRTYAQAGGFANIEAPFALYNLGASAAATAYFFDNLTVPSTATWSGPGILRLAWQVEGSASVSYSAPGTPDQASAGVALGVSCGYSAGVGSSPCQSPNFPVAPPGSNALFGSRTFATSQSFSELMIFDLAINSDIPFNYLFTAGVSASLGFQYGTPIGVLNGLAVGDFLNTGQLVAVTVYDPLGNVVNVPAIPSDSGFDYANIAAVPAPPSLALLVTGFLVIGARLSRRARRLVSGVE